MAIMVLRTCEQVEGGLPSSVKSKMYVNIAIDFAVGLVPFFGDIGDGRLKELSSDEGLDANILL
jgi:hypothetical protein